MQAMVRDNYPSRSRSWSFPITFVAGTATVNKHLPQVMKVIHIIIKPG
jgi:hypothetical protein